MAMPAYLGQNFVKKLNHQFTPTTDPSSVSLPSPYVVCVTGSGRGIGAATAQAYAKAGATGLILTSRTTSALEGTKQDILAVAKKPDLKIVVVAMEVQDEAATQKLSKTIEAEFGRLDVLVNNAGVLATDAAMFNEFDQVPMDQVHAVTDVNYIGKMLSCKYLIPLLLASDNGAKSIVNITSMSSLEPHFLAAFGISELAVNRLTEHLANQYKDRGLLVYALHPGTVKSTPPPGTPSMFLEAMIDDLGLAGAISVWLTKAPREWLSGRYISSNWDVDELSEKKDEIVKHDKLKMVLAL